MTHRPPERFHAFVSYTTREDEIQLVKPIADLFLNTILRPAIERSLGEPPIFYDGYSLYSAFRGSLPYSGALEIVLKFAVEESEILVALLSPAYATSYFCQVEWSAMAAKNRRPWFDVFRNAPIPELRDRRVAQLQVRGLDRVEAWLRDRHRRRHPHPARSGSAIVPVLWKHQAAAETIASTPWPIEDWSVCGRAFAGRMGLTEHLIRHGSVSPTWVSDVERDECLCRDAMAATARRIVDALRQRRNEYAAD